MKKRCSVRGCRRPERAKRLCSAHYQRKSVGSALKGPIRTPVRGTIAERMQARLKVDEKTGCHLWTGYRNTQGYGRMYVKATRQLAHRIAWEVAYGPIPEGMIVMHAVCDNPPCCNPAHLKLGTHAENARDRVKKGRGPGAREHDLKRHPQWAKRPRRRWLARHPPCLRQADQASAPAQPLPRELRPRESRPSSLPWGESGQVALRLLEVSIATAGRSAP